MASTSPSQQSDTDAFRSLIGTGNSSATTTSTTSGSNMSNSSNSNIQSSTAKTSGTSSSTFSDPPKRRRPPMLVLNGNKEPFSPSSGTNFSNVNLTSHNKNSATTTTTLSATPSSSVFPSIRTPKDVVLQDLALQCISPGLPSFPSVIRDAMVKSKSIQEEQRKIIAQRMKDNGGNFSQSHVNSDTRMSASSDDDLEADMDKSSDNIKSNTGSISKSSAPSVYAETKAGLNISETTNNDELKDNNASKGTNSLFNAASNASSLNNVNHEAHYTASNAANTKANKSFGDLDSNVAVTIDRTTKSANSSFTLSRPPISRDSQRVSLENGTSGLPKSSSTPKPLNISVDQQQKSAKQIIHSGNIIIEAVPTPTLPSHPKFNRKETSSMKSTTKRAPPPTSIKTAGLDSENPSIRSAPLDRGPAPFSPYSLSQIPGYQAYYLNQALAAQKGGFSANKTSSTTQEQPFAKQAQTTGLNGVSNFMAQPAAKEFTSNAVFQNSNLQVPSATGGARSGNVPSIMSPIYPNAAGTPSTFGYARTPTVLTNPFYYARHPSLSQAQSTPVQHNQPFTSSQRVGFNKSNAVSSALGASVNGLQPGLTSSAASKFYRDPRMVPLYVSGRPTIPPMTASAAHWTGRTFRSHQYNKNDDDSDDDDEDDGRDPEDAALSDDETDQPKSRKSAKRPSSSNDDDDDDENDKDQLDDVEQKAISEEDEQLQSSSVSSVQSKKRKIHHVPSISNIGASAPTAGTTITNGEMYDLASGVSFGGAGSATGAYSNEQPPLSAAFGDFAAQMAANFSSVRKANVANRTREEIEMEALKKQRFLEICSEMWDLMRN